MESGTLKPLILVYLALIVLLAVAVGIAYLPLGNWGPVAAMSVAAAKAALVMIFFMRLNAEDSLVRVFAVAGIFWLAILFLLSLSDYLTRGTPR